MSEELNPEQIARDIKTLRDEGAEIDAEEKRLGLTYAPESPASGGYVFRAIAARYEELAARAALGSRGVPQEEPAPNDALSWCPHCGATRPVHQGGCEYERFTALRGVGMWQAPTCPDHGPMRILYVQHVCDTCGSIDELAPVVPVGTPQEKAPDGQ